MIVEPIFIVGAPRSGTSLLQKILRDHPSFWSLPSESEFIFDPHFHPKKFNWQIEAGIAFVPLAKTGQQIRQQFNQHVAPARFWQQTQFHKLNWANNRQTIWRRKAFNAAYFTLIPLFSRWRWAKQSKRLVDKSISHCLRLKALDALFPKAKFIFITRHGVDCVASLIKGWQHPDRFFSYRVPLPLNIEGYQSERWNFFLPPQWEQLVNKPLPTVCAAQWVAANQAVLQTADELKANGRFLQIKLESLTQTPANILWQIADFIDLPYEPYFSQLANELPVINASSQAMQMAEAEKTAVLRQIMPTLASLSYT